MPINKVGEAMFCDNCGTAGSFIGTVDEDAFRAGSENSMGRLALSIRFQDRNGALTRMSVVYSDSVPVGYNTDVAKFATAAHEALSAEILVGRIKDCRANCEQCPAVGSRALQEMVNSNL